MPTRAVSKIARRIHGWSWQAFPIGMGTGAVYVTLSGLKEHTEILTDAETYFYFLNMFFFLLNTITLALQAMLYPRQALRLITDPVKGVFVPLIVLSYATIIIGTINYVVPEGYTSLDFIYVLYWTYIWFACLTCFPMLMIWFNKGHDLAHFTPAYAFLVFPLMLVGVVAFNVLKVIPPEDHRSVGILLTGYFFQGLGFFMTFFYIGIYILRIMTTGFLEGHQANGAFVACGPPGFTALVLLKLGEQSKIILKHHDLVSPNAGEIWYAVSVLGALMLYGLAIFLFFMGAFPWYFKVHKDLKDILGCWALTFPNVGWISTTRILGDIFNLPGLQMIHLIMTIAVCITWLILIVLTGIAFWKGQIFNSKEEDILKDSLLGSETDAYDDSEVRDLEQGAPAFDHSQLPIHHP